MHLHQLTISSHHFWVGLVLHPVRNFQYCQPAQNQPKSYILFHKNGSLQELYKITLTIHAWESVYLALLLKLRSTGKDWFIKTVKKQSSILLLNLLTVFMYQSLLRKHGLYKFCNAGNKIMHFFSGYLNSFTVHTYLVLNPQLKKT